MFLEILPLELLHIILATSRQLRFLVHQSAKSVTLPKIGSHLEDIMVLAANSWPNLIQLKLTDSQLQLAWMGAPHSLRLKHLDLAGSSLGAVGVQKLQSVSLPNLARLRLSSTRLNTAAIKQLVMASWPVLEELSL